MDGAGANDQENPGVLAIQDFLDGKPAPETVSSPDLMLEHYLSVLRVYRVSSLNTFKSSTLISFMVCPVYVASCP